MNRRNALASLATITGGAIILPQFLTGCDKGPYPYELFNWGDTEWFNEFAEFILPSSDGIPGAKEANVGDFVQRYVTDCYKPVNQVAFLAGLAEFRKKVEETHKSHFIDLSDEIKTSLFTELEAEAIAFNKSRPVGTPPHFYSQLKGTIMFGYFTSEQGATKALNYLPVPGKQGIIPYNCEKAWAL